MAVENVPPFDRLLGYGEESLFSMAVENVPPFDRLLGYGEGSLFSMAVENVPPFDRLLGYEEGSLFSRPWKMYPLLIDCLDMGRGVCSQGRGKCTPF